MVRKECRILFLRDNEKIRNPLITIEERNGIIRQCYGIYDSINTDEEIRDFITEYAEVRGWQIKASIYGDGTERRVHGQYLTQEEINRLLAGTFDD